MLETIEKGKVNPDTWTKFYDMHSGGGAKTDYEQIYIHAPESEAAEIFEEKFGRNPYNTTCNCCGGDYSIDEGTLEQLVKWQLTDGETLQEFQKRPKLLFIEVDRT